MTYNYMERLKSRARPSSPARYLLTLSMNKQDNNTNNWILQAALLFLLFIFLLRFMGRLFPFILGILLVLAIGGGIYFLWSYLEKGRAAKARRNTVEGMSEERIDFCRSQIRRNEEEARQAVRDLAKGGAVVIKVALEPGGEAGAPWSGGHHHPAHSGHKHGHAPGPSHGESSDPGNWPLLPEAVVRAIVEEAHRHDLKVTAHIGEEQGARLAVTAGVDEWAHMPCGPITGRVLKLAAEQGVKIVSTLDTLSQCAGARSNAKVWATFEGETLYGSEIAHPDVPWGVNAQELLYLMPLFEGDPFRVLQSATSKAGAQLGIPLLGTLKPGAPADLIAVKGGVAHNLKKLEYPALVISGGTVVVNRFE